ncbi:MAG: DoxX family membrane protein [bacterium]|nr:DoxX family membrane protein [bacterium]
MFVNNHFNLSFRALRIGLAAVFIWFGIDKFFHPLYWINAWVPQDVLSFFGKVGIGDMQFIYLNGIFELIVGVSLLTGVFIRIFSFLAAIFLFLVILFIGFNEVIVRDLGLIGGFIAIALWPRRRL